MSKVETKINKLGISAFCFSKDLKCIFLWIIEIAIGVKESFLI